MASVETLWGKPLPSQEFLLSILTYDQTTGYLYWKLRPVEHFKSYGRWKSWNNVWVGKPALATPSNGYRIGRIDNVNHRAHRVIWKMLFGVDPIQIDHIDGNRGNNRLSNLREVTTIDNSRNMALRPNNTSGVIGVSWAAAKNKWAAQITVNYRAICLGRFSSFEDARAARKAAEIKYGFHPNHGRPAQ